MKQLGEIEKRLRSLKPNLEREFGVKEPGVFGSYVRAEQNAESDVDILVDFADPPAMFRYIELEQRLSTELGTRVDLVMKSALKPFIGKQILSETIFV